MTDYRINLAIKMQREASHVCACAARCYYSDLICGDDTWQIAADNARKDADNEWKLLFGDDEHRIHLACRAVSRHSDEDAAKIIARLLKHVA